MKKIIFYFLILLFAVWLGITMQRNPGYVLISINDLSIETSLWFLVIVLLAGFLIIYMLLRFGRGTSNIASYLKHWFGGRMRRRAYEQTVSGLYDLVEGNWKTAERKIFRAAKHSDMQLINYLAAALLAQRQREYKRRDSYLHLAYKISGEKPLVAKLIQVTLKIENQKWQEAAVILEDLFKIYPKNVLVLELLQQVYLELGDWRGLQRILPVLHKYKILDVVELETLEQDVYSELLLAGYQDQSVIAIWNDLPRHLKQNPFLVGIYAEYLLDNRKNDEAEGILKTTLRKNLNFYLLELYASLSSTKPIKQLMRAEKWLQASPDDVGLLLCLGRICRRQKLWGKARHYLERGLKLEEGSAFYLELGRLMAEQNDLKGAIDFYEKALGV